MFETAALSYIVAGIISATLVTYGLIKLVLVFREAAEEDAAQDAFGESPLVVAVESAPADRVDGTFDDADDDNALAGLEHHDQPAPAPSISLVGFDTGPGQWRHEFTASELYESGEPLREPTLAEKKRKQVWAAWGEAWVTVGRGWRGQLVMFRSYQAAAAHGERIMADVMEECRTRALKAVEEHQAWIAWAAAQKAEAEALAAREAEAAAAMELQASFVPLALEMAPQPAVAWLEGLTELARPGDATAEPLEPDAEVTGSTDQPDVDEGVQEDAAEAHPEDASPQMSSVYIESLHVEVPHVEAESEEEPADELPEQPPLLEDELLAESMAAEVAEDDETPSLAWLDGPAMSSEAEELVEEVSTFNAEAEPQDAGSPGEDAAGGVLGESDQTEAAAESEGVVDEPVEPQEQPGVFEPVLVDTSVFGADVDAPPDQASEEDESISLKPVAADMLPVDVASLEDIQMSDEVVTAESEQDDEAVISWIVPVTEDESATLPGRWDDYEEQASKPEAETRAPATDLQLEQEPVAEVAESDEKDAKPDEEPTGDAGKTESMPLSGAGKSPAGRAERPSKTGQFVPEIYAQLDEYIEAGELSLATADLLPNLPGISVSYEYDPEEASAIKRRRQSDFQRLHRLVDDVPGPKVNAAVAYIEAAAAMRALLNLSLDRLKAGSLHAAASSAAKAIAWTRLLDRVCSQQGLDDRRPDQVRVWFLLAEIYAAMDDAPVAAYALNHAEHYSLESGNDAWMERISDVRSRLQRKRFKAAA